MTLHLIPLNFLIYEENFILFFISVCVYCIICNGWLTVVAMAFICMYKNDYAEAEFLDFNGTKVLIVFLLATHSHFY
jgi:hypothetical protein